MSKRGLQVRDRRVLVLLHGLIVIAGLLDATVSRGQTETAVSAPDVLFLVIDDLNDWIALLDPQAPITTPNLARLARRGMLFSQAHCASPACNPSRVATLTGLRPSTSGVYGNSSDWRHALPQRLTIMQRFMAAGYHVRGAGKIFHHQLEGAFHDSLSFHDFRQMRPQSYPPQKLNGAPGYGSRNTDWGVWPPREVDAIDYGTVDYCVRALQQRDPARPLFLACGIFKPHSPFFAPQRYHELYRDVDVPVRRADDWSDLPSGAISLLKSKRWFWRGMMQLESERKGAYQEFLSSYAACVAFADAQVGRLLDALDGGKQRDNTVIVLWSDNGFHLGEKDHIEKFALWEKTTHVPLIISAPKVTPPNSRCDLPVDLTALYPTLLELCGLSADPCCDGVSLLPLLKQEDRQWSRPALITYQRGNHAVRSQRWRYIHYADGSEELYDHQNDAHEWNNLASHQESQAVIAWHRQWLPETEAATAPDLRN